MSQAGLPVRARHRGVAAEVAVHARARARRRRDAKDSQRLRIAHGEVEWFATPRRLAVRVHGVAERQPDQEIKRQGPAVANAFDAAGQPTKAATGFAASCGVSVEELQQVDGPKGRVLMFVGTKKGEPTAALLPGIVKAALDALPIAKRMRWGAGEHEFVRPVHWVSHAVRHDCRRCEILGVRAGQAFARTSLSRAAVRCRSPARRNMSKRCEKAHVVADVAERRERIRSGATALAQAIGGHAVIEDALLDEVTALVEWPVPLLGRFDERYLQLPQEVPIATMQDHQRYFPVRDAHGKLMQRVHHRRQYRKPRAGQGARRQRARRAAAARRRGVLLGQRSPRAARSAPRRR